MNFLNRQIDKFIKYFLRKKTEMKFVQSKYLLESCLGFLVQTFSKKEINALFHEFQIIQ